MSSTVRTAAGVLCAALLLTTSACGGDDSQPASAGRSATEVRASQSAADSEHNAADVRFAEDMVPHHSQAVEMVDLTEGHDLDADVQELADGIGSAQEREIALMTGWLQGWGEKVPTGGGDMTMRGMLSGDELDQLRSADDPAFQRLWLTQMTQHHQGAIPMAQQELAEGTNPAALELAREIIKTQKAELYEMGGLIGQ